MCEGVVPGPSGRRDRQVTVVCHHPVVADRTPRRRRRTAVAPPAGTAVPRPRPTAATVQVVAHRGASAARPEHTAAAYHRAIEDGVGAVECDVRLTADGHLVCLHDRRVDRTSNGRGVVSQLTLAELRQLDWGRWGRWQGGEPAGLLTARELFELVAAAGRRVEIAVETKHPSQPAGRVERRWHRCWPSSAGPTPPARCG